MSTIQLYIWKNDSIRDIQEKFIELFPGLQIKIYKHVECKNGIQSQDIMFCPEVRMIEINPGFRDGRIGIPGSLRVTDLEQAFFEKFGLFVQVFRKNGSPVEEASRMSHFLLERTTYLVKEGFPAYSEGVYFRQIPFGC